MMATRVVSAEVSSDAELVSESLSGKRDAFGQIVARYQSLVCSLAYSATGSLGHSEDLAQETFVTAWAQLADLREPEKLRAWICGIARNLINNWLRKQGREPSHKAESLQGISEAQSPEPLPIERAISNEEQAILWRSLERIPDIYREPLVLFYREHQSIEAVARDLELSQDVVKQRLSRGRKLLHQQVLAFVEGALEKTSPGQTFTLGVVASLPIVSTSAKAAAAGAALAKAGTATTIGTLFGSVVGFLPALGSVFLTYKSFRQQQIENRTYAQSGPMTSEKRQEILALKRRHGSKSSVYLYLGMACNMGGLLFIQLHHGGEMARQHPLFLVFVLGLTLYCFVQAWRWRSR